MTLTNGCRTGWGTRNRSTDSSSRGGCRRSRRGGGSTRSGRSSTRRRSRTRCWGGWCCAPRGRRRSGWGSSGRGSDCPKGCYGGRWGDCCRSTSRAVGPSSCSSARNCSPRGPFCGNGPIGGSCATASGWRPCGGGVCSSWNARGRRCRTRGSARSSKWGSGRPSRNHTLDA